MTWNMHWHWDCVWFWQTDNGVKIGLIYVVANIEGEERAPALHPDAGEGC